MSDKVGRPANPLVVLILGKARAEWITDYI